MLEALIAEGEALEGKVAQGRFGNYFKTVDFETWIAKAVGYLEGNKPKSAVTSRVLENYSKMNANNNFAIYQMTLGALKSLN